LRRAPPDQQLAQQRGRERMGERLDAMGAFERGQTRAVKQARAAELAGIVKKHLPAVVGQQHQVGVDIGLGIGRVDGD